MYVARGDFFGASERVLTGLWCDIQYNKTGFFPGSDSPKKSPQGLPKNKTGCSTSNIKKDTVSSYSFTKL